MADFVQPTKSEIAEKMASFTVGETPNWEGFINWVHEFIDLAFSKGYEQGHQDGADDVEDDDDEDETSATG